MYVFAGNKATGRGTLHGMVADKMGISINIDSDIITCKLDFHQ